MHVLVLALLRQHLIGQISFWADIGTALQTHAASEGEHICSFRWDGCGGGDGVDTVLCCIL